MEFDLKSGIVWVGRFGKGWLALRFEVYNETELQIPHGCQNRIKQTNLSERDNGRFSDRPEESCLIIMSSVSSVVVVSFAIETKRGHLKKGYNISNIHSNKDGFVIMQILSSTDFLVYGTAGRCHVYQDSMLD